MVVWILVGVAVVVLVVVVMVALMGVRRPAPAEPRQQTAGEVDIGARVGLEQLECRKCGAVLEESSIGVKEGLSLVSCPYCGSRYQLFKDAEQ